MNTIELNKLSFEIINAAIEVHKALGPGLLEKCYSKALMRELSLRHFSAEEEVCIPLVYKGISLDNAFRADIIVENSIILELKATENDNSLYPKQLFTYLKLKDMKLGLLINFNKERLVDGITRVVNNLK